MYCKHCGKEIADDSKFCRYCGKAQDSTNEVQPEKPVGSIEPQSGSQSIKVELVTPKKVSEDGVRKGVLTILKEIGLIALFVGIAFLAKEITFQAINSQQFPEISQEDQKAFNDAVFKKKFPNAVLINYGSRSVFAFENREVDIDIENKTSLELFQDFVRYKDNRDLSVDESEILRDLIGEINEG